ncbi:MAG: site-specific DNA-methyltransferase, partial [Desulfobacteraceae bacterium]
MGGGARAKRLDIIRKSKENKRIVYQHPGEDVDGFYILNGEQIIFWENVYKEIDGQVVPAEALTDVWYDISWTGIANEGGVTLKNGKKPEMLLKRIIELCTNKDDLVLDFFIGSGTTCAVAHKMGRQYIGIEQLDYGDNDSIIRLQNVIKGDKSGISQAGNWQGGGDFICCELMKFNEAFMERIQA